MTTDLSVLTKLVSSKLKASETSSPSKLGIGRRNLRSSVKCPILMCSLNVRTKEAVLQQMFVNTFRIIAC